jgi:hypothetical protein
LKQKFKKYFQSGLTGESKLRLEWTNQHGCGGKVNCDLILQYMCQEVLDQNDLDRLRDGLTTATQDFTESVEKTASPSFSSYQQRKQNNVKLERGIHESWSMYDSCINRERNAGLFIADQILRNNQKGYSSAVFTRQNPNGDRSGYECPEERDYYPYWHPSQWKDIAVLTSSKNSSMCDYFKKESFNIKPKHFCAETFPDQNRLYLSSRWNNEKDCVKNNDRWIEFYNYLEKAKSNELKNLLTFKIYF